MKRIFVLGTTLIFSLGLAGCDLIPTEVIDVISEELCREDPTNELCQVDNLSDLENQVIIDLFNDLLSSYDVDDLETYCETYFSVSNIELLDSCRLDENALFPVGIEDFEVLSVTIVDDEYMVELQSKTYADRIMFSLQIGIDDNKVLVTKMVSGPIYVLSPPNAKEDIVDLIDLFILEMENEQLTDEQVCALFDGIDNDCDGITDAVRKFKAGADLSKKINILDPDDDDDGILVGEISYEIDGHVTVLKIKFDLDNSGEELKLRIHEIDSEVTFIPNSLTVDQLELFVGDITSPELNEDEVCSIWSSDEGFDNDCNIRIAACCGGRIKHEFVFKTITPVGDEDDEDQVYEATFRSDFNGHVTVLKISFTEDNSLEELKLHITDVQTEFIPDEEVAAQLEKFIIELTNPELIDDEVCSAWSSDEGVDNDCDLRISFNDPIRHEFIVKTIIPIGDDTDNPMYEATYESDFNGHVTVLKISFTEDDSSGVKNVLIANLQADVQMEFYPNPDTEFELVSLIADLSNPDITEAEMCLIWGDGVDDDCNGIVAIDPVIKYVFIFKTIIPVDDDVDNPMYEATFESDFNGHITVLKISFTEDNTLEKLALHNIHVSLFARGADDCDDDNDGVCDVDNKDEAAMLYQMYLDAYMDPTVTRDILETYFEIIPSEEYFEIRDKFLSSGEKIEFIAIIGPEVCIGTYAVIGPEVCIGTYVAVAVSTGIRDGAVIGADPIIARSAVTVIIRKYIDKSTPLLTILDPDDDGDSIPTEDKLAVLDDFKNNLNDETVTMENFFAQLIIKGTDEPTCPLSSPVYCEKTDGYNVDSIELLEVNGLSYITISQSPELLTSELEDINVSYIAFFYYNEEENIMFELVPVDGVPELGGTEDTLPVFTLDELSRYTGLGGTTAYIAVDGIIYDVTFTFTNGQHRDMQLGGTDATEVFASSPHGDSLLDSLTIIGLLEVTN